MPIRGRLGALDTDSFETINVHTPIAANNVGHRMLMKMGWKLGTGLGPQGQGVCDDRPAQTPPFRCEPQARAAAPAGC